jgi:transposase-like protein
MKNDEKNELKKWVDQWRRREEALERIHGDEIRRVDTEQSILTLEDAFQHAIRQDDIRRDSGLVEMKHWFSRLGVTSEAIE